MLKIRIDNTGYEVPEGTTILEAAGKAGKEIPTLCHKDGVPHYTSCMVCMIKDRHTDKFLPSCSALVQDGMDIVTSGDEVTEIRKKAVTLLLTEHRAECEAPCRIVCPAGLNIPLMNRHLSAGDIKAASELSRSELTAEEFRCITCPGYCENACRRKKTDTPVSIRNIQLFIYLSISGDKTIQSPDKQQSEKTEKSTKAIDPGHVRNRFSSRTGKLEEAEMLEWLKECEPGVPRHREITSFDVAGEEAKSCMHCDCRAAGDCRLRDLAEHMAVKDPRGKITGSPITKKINHQTGLIFESAKCVKCALCVRICEDSTDDPALCFLHRGFVTVLSEPVTESFENVLRKQADAVIKICPTGALSYLRNARTD